MTKENKQGGFCTQCDRQVESFEGLQACPNCGTKSYPCLWEDQVDVSINWHELRVLIMWAERWWNSNVAKTDTSKMNPIFTIAERIRRQHPERCQESPLTFAGEVQQVVDAFGNNVQHNVPGVEGGKPIPPEEGRQT